MTVFSSAIYHVIFVVFYLLVSKEFINQTDEVK